MVRAVRAGQACARSAASFGVSVGACLLGQTGARQTHRPGEFTNCKPGRPWNRTPAEVEQRILSVRTSLREESVLGEYGPDAIGLALRENDALEQVPARTTIYRVLARHGAARWRASTTPPAPPKGWYLPDLAVGRAELDSFDFIEDLKIADGPLVVGAHRHEPARRACRRLDHGAAQRRATAGSAARALAPRRAARLRAVRQRHHLPGRAPVCRQRRTYQPAVSRAWASSRCSPHRASRASRMPSKASTACGKARSGSAIASPMSPRSEAVSARYIAAYRAKTAAAAKLAPSRRAFPHRLPTRPQRPAQGHDHLPAPKQRGRHGSSARQSLPRRQALGTSTGPLRG